MTSLTKGEHGRGHPHLAQASIRVNWRAGALHHGAPWDPPKKEAVRNGVRSLPKRQGRPDSSKKPFQR